PFPEMTFRWETVEPPIVVFGAPEIDTPALTFLTAAVPLARSPMMFPWMRVPELVVPSIRTPLRLLPEVTLPPFWPGFDVAAPIVLLEAPSWMKTPSSPLEMELEPL